MTEGKINEGQRRLDGINGSVASIDRSISQIMIDLATLKTKIALWSAVGSLLAASIVSSVVALGLGQ